MDKMDFKIESNRIYREDEDGNVIAYITFPDVKDGVVDIDHTIVDDTLQGQGVAGQLMQATVDKIRAENKKAIPTCSYAIKWFEKHTEYEDLLSK